MNPYVGRVWSCRVAQVDARWVMLDPAPAGQRSALEAMIPLPRAEAPQDVAVNHTLDVFVFLDTHDQPLATSKRPTLLPGEVGFLEVADSTPFGFFLSWGLSRDLFLPFKETPGPLEVGQKVAVTPYIDNTGRLAATGQLSQVLEQGTFDLNERVEGLVWRTEPEIGTFVILDKHVLALLPEAEPHTIKPGETHSFRISRILPDGKLEVSLRGLRHEELEHDAEKLLTYLAQPRSRPLSDDSDPEWVRTALGLSKKALKRAAGRLLRLNKLHLDGKGYYKLGADPELDADAVAQAQQEARKGKGGQRPLMRKPGGQPPRPEPSRREPTGWEEPESAPRREPRAFSERPVRREPRAFSERPVRQESREFSERPARREPREFSERPARQEPREFSERPARREPREFSERPARREPREFSERPARREPREFSERPARREPREFSERPARREERRSPLPARAPRREFIPDAPRARKKDEEDT